MVVYLLYIFIASDRLHDALEVVGAEGVEVDLTSPLTSDLTSVLPLNTGRSSLLFVEEGLQGVREIHLALLRILMEAKYSLLNQTS